MSPRKPSDIRSRLVDAGIELFRRNGYVATTVDEICSAAGVTKGAFFHHFATKEVLAVECLRAWDELAAGLGVGGDDASRPDPVDRLMGHMEFFIGLFEKPDMLKSCLAGTTAQEVSETHPILREAANTCLVNARQRFQRMLDEAFAARGLTADTAGLATLWVATIQGALIMHKASQDVSVIRASLGQVKKYIAALLNVH